VLELNGASIMMRKIAIGLTAVLVTGGLTLSASAHHGGAGQYRDYSKSGVGTVGAYGHFTKRHAALRHHEHPWTRLGYGGIYGGGDCWQRVKGPHGSVRKWACHPSYRPPR
jgi:hypothetical protein